MKLRLHVSAVEEIEVLDPADKNADPDLRKRIAVRNVTFTIPTDGHDESVFAAKPSGRIHINNLTPAAADFFKVGKDYEFAPA